MEAFGQYNWAITIVLHENVGQWGCGANLCTTWRLKRTVYNWTVSSRWLLNWLARKCTESVNGHTWCFPWFMWGEMHVSRLDKTLRVLFFWDFWKHLLSDDKLHCALHYYVSFHYLYQIKKVRWRRNDHVKRSCRHRCTFHFLQFYCSVSVAYQRVVAARFVTPTRFVTLPRLLFRPWSQ